MKIGIRADGGPLIGMGHIMRTLALAKELSKEAEVFYICKQDDTSVKKYCQGINKVKDEGFQIKLVDGNDVIGGLNKIEADILITDSYDVDEEYFNKTKSMFKKTGYIDDMNLYYFNVDFIINQNINAEDFVYRANCDTKFFLGTRYVMLRDEFRNGHKNIIKEKVENILITMGGGDPFNITETILKSIKGMDYNFNVVVGPSFHKVQSLKKLSDENYNINLIFNPNMAEVMKNSDLAITACGSTLYELASMNIPTLGIIVADNQTMVANKMHSKGLIINMGWYNKLSGDEIRYSLSNICENYHDRCEMVKSQNIVNINGAFELCKNIIGLLK